MDKNITKDKLGRMKQKAGSMTRTAFTFAQLWLSRRYATKVDREAFDLQHKTGVYIHTSDPSIEARPCMARGKAKNPASV